MKVEIFSTPSCMYCNMMKAYLKQNNIEYIDYNVAEDHARAKEMVELTGQMGVPVSKIGEDVIIGFDQPRIAQL
ncbi:protein containing Glutaredoxin domain, partial [sediment metagenome]